MEGSTIGRAIKACVSDLFLTKVQRMHESSTVDEYRSNCQKVLRSREVIFTHVIASIGGNMVRWVPDEKWSRDRILEELKTFCRAFRENDDVDPIVRIIDCMAVFFDTVVCKHLELFRCNDFDKQSFVPIADRLDKILLQVFGGSSVTVSQVEITRQLEDANKKMEAIKKDNEQLRQENDTMIKNMAKMKTVCDATIIAKNKEIQKLEMQIRKLEDEIIKANEDDDDGIDMG